MDGRGHLQHGRISLFFLLVLVGEEARDLFLHQEKSFLLERSHSLLLLAFLVFVYELNGTSLAFLGVSLVKNVELGAF